MNGYWNAHSDMDWQGRVCTGQEPCRECGGKGGFCDGDEAEGAEWVACARCGGKGEEP